MTFWKRDKRLERTKLVTKEKLEWVDGCEGAQNYFMGFWLRVLGFSKPSDTIDLCIIFFKRLAWTISLG